MKKYNFIYKTTNLINNKIYIGVHSTNNLKDGYIGCGVYSENSAKQKSSKTRFYGFCKAVTRYGYSNFKREILYFFKSKEEAYYFESKIVNQEFINCKNTYNIKLGGVIAPSSKGIKRTKKFKKQKAKQIMSYMDKLIDIHSKEYVVVDMLNNKIYNVKNLSKFAVENNLKLDCLLAVNRGISQLHRRRWWCCFKESWIGEVVLKKGFTYKDSVTLYHNSGKIISVKSLEEAYNLTNVDRSTLSKVIRGKLNQTGGWSRKAWEC